MGPNIFELLRIIFNTTPPENLIHEKTADEVANREAVRSGHFWKRPPLKI